MMNTTPQDAIGSFPKQYALTRRFTLGAPRSFNVSTDGERVLFLRSSGSLDPSNALWLLSKGAEPALLFGVDGRDEGNLTAAEKARRERMREQASGVVSYSARPDHSEVVFALGGQLHVIDVASSSTRDFPSDGNAFDPTFEPEGTSVAYVSGPTLRVTDGQTDRLVPGTDEAEASSGLVSWGSAEFVAAEEMGRGRGYWWAPSGKRLAACRVDTSAVEEWWISSPEAPSSAPRAIRYPAAGTTNASVELWIVDVDDGPTLQIDWQQDTYEYLADVQWGEQLLLTVQTRDQRQLVVLEVDPDDGTTIEIARIEDDHWVELQPRTPKATNDGLLFVVDQPGPGGMRRLVVDEGAEQRPLGSDSHNVRQLLGVNDSDVYATLTTDGTDSVIARISGESSELLTDPGRFSSGVLGGGTLVAITAQPDGDTSYDVRWADGSVTSIDSLAATPGFPCTPTFHVVGERRLNTTLNLPTGHDGSPLPVLLDPYGGPHAQRVLRVRNGYATSQWFAEQGFAVVVTDGRGTPGRGPAFEREIWGDFATTVLDDQLDALHALAAERPELDLSRVGIRGWSFGGYLAALAVMRRPDDVHAAVAGAPVTDWKLYDTHYTERYIGHPDEHPENYEASSLLSDAPNLARPLMLIHGLADDNVVAAHTLVLSQALLEAGRPHEVLPLSGVTHMTPQEQVAENLLHLQRDFLLTHLDSDHD